jgi:hypothetical protein
VDRLSDLGKARLIEIVHLRRELGDLVWAGWGQADLPPILDSVFPYSLATALYSSDWYIATVQHEAFHAYQGILARERLENA